MSLRTAIRDWLLKPTPAELAQRKRLDALLAKVERDILAGSKLLPLVRDPVTGAPGVRPLPEDGKGS